MRRLFVVLSLVLGLAACAVDPQSSPRPAISGPGPDQGADRQEAALPPPDVTNPARLKGLNARQVTALLGQPSFTRKDAPAEIWQYRVRACTLDLFLYDEGATHRVAHYAVRSPQVISDQACFDEVLSALRGVPTS
jgi:hypothetical protein